MQSHVNRWTVYREPIATWVADLSTVQKRPDRLLDWVVSVLQAGETSDFGRIASASGDSHKPPRAEAEQFCRTKYEAASKLDLLNFLWPNIHSQYWVESLVWYYDRSGNLTQSWTTDLSRILHDSSSSELARSLDDVIAPPIEVYGMEIDYARGEPIPNYAMVSFSIASDIWFQTIIDHDQCEMPGRTVTNLDLHQLNAPRLNRYLQVLKKVTLELGGRWSLDTDNQYQLAVYTGQICDDGVVMAR
ncbi:MAG: hypothetical protein L0241_12305 [Planctomycetia bacterium]|nr:hypothetical protein [Planctomycetia bacterium]